MNKKFIYLTFFMILGVGYLSFYFNQYHIVDNNVSIESNLSDWLNRGKYDNEEKLNPNILQMEQLDSTTSYITLFKLDNYTFGYAQLIKGLNGKFKISYSGYGTGLYNPSSFEIIETNKEKYIVLFGGNPNLKTDHISLESKYEGVNGFTSDVSKDKYFLKYRSIPGEVKRPISVDFKVLYYDMDNNKLSPEFP